MKPSACQRNLWIPPGEAFDLQRGTWFQEITWQPLQCEYADRIEQEHLNHFRGHKMADYVWDSATQSRLERQVSFFFQYYIPRFYNSFTIFMRFFLFNLHKR